MPTGSFQDYLLGKTNELLSLTRLKKKKKLVQFSEITFIAPPVKKQSIDDSLVVFVVDVSGSMCVTEETPKGFGLFQVRLKFKEDKT